MLQATDDLRVLLKEAHPRLKSIDLRSVEATTSPGKWSKKEILGHLIDSAANNHQRFVRAQIEDQLTFPGYKQNDWVSTQEYRRAEWLQLVEWWHSYNSHLVHLLSFCDQRALDRPCTIGSDNPVTLRFLIEDYVRHLKHHLDQLLADPGPKR